MDLELRKYDKQDSLGYEVGLNGNKDVVFSFNKIEEKGDYYVLLEQNPITKEMIEIAKEPLSRIAEINIKAYEHARDKLVIDAANKVDKLGKNITNFLDNTDRGKNSRISF